MGGAALVLRRSRARRAIAGRSPQRPRRGRRVRRWRCRLPPPRRGTDRGRVDLLSGHPRSALGLDRARPGYCAPALRGTPLAPRVGVQERESPGVSRLPDPARLGESPRLGCRRSDPHDAAGRDRNRPAARDRLAAAIAARRATSSRPRDAVRTGRDRALLPPAASRSAVQGERDHRVEPERSRAQHAVLLRARGARAPDRDPWATTALDL